MLFVIMATCYRRIIHQTRWKHQIWLRTWWGVIMMDVKSEEEHSTTCMHYKRKFLVPREMLIDGWSWLDLGGIASDPSHHRHVALDFTFWNTLLYVTNSVRQTSAQLAHTRNFLATTILRWKHDLWQWILLLVKSNLIDVGMICMYRPHPASGPSAPTSPTFQFVTWNADNWSSLQHPCIWYGVQMKKDNKSIGTKCMLDN